MKVTCPVCLAELEASAADLEKGYVTCPVCLHEIAVEKPAFQFTAIVECEACGQKFELDLDEVRRNGNKYSCPICLKEHELELGELED